MHKVLGIKCLQIVEIPMGCAWEKISDSVYNFLFQLGLGLSCAFTRAFCASYALLFPQIFPEINSFKGLVIPFFHTPYYNDYYLYTYRKRLLV
jgi:hypothetical protein